MSESIPGRETGKCAREHSKRISWEEKTIRGKNSEKEHNFASFFPPGFMQTMCASILTYAKCQFVLRVWIERKSGSLFPLNSKTKNTQECYRLVCIPSYIQQARHEKENDLILNISQFLFPANPCWKFWRIAKILYFLFWQKCFNVFVKNGDAIQIKGQGRRY